MVAGQPAGTPRGRWSTLDVRTDGPVAWVRFDRPDARNAATTEMVGELPEALAELAADDALSVVVLTGNGRMFCPGADLDRAGGDRPVELPPLAVYQSATLLHEMPQLTVAAVNGGCAGAGFAWAAACDLRIAAARARFSTAFLELGLASELGLPWTLTRALGGAVARELCFLPRKLDAEQARQLGFVSTVLPDDRFDDEVAALARELGGRSGTALRTLKANFLLAENTGLADFVEEEGRRHQSFFTGAARDRAMAALREQGARVRTTTADDIPTEGTPDGH